MYSTVPRVEIISITSCINRAVSLYNKPTHTNSTLYLCIEDSFHRFLACQPNPKTAHRIAHTNEITHLFTVPTDPRTGNPLATQRYKVKVQVTSASDKCNLDLIGRSAPPTPRPPNENQIN